VPADYRTRVFRYATVERTLPEGTLIIMEAYEPKHNADGSVLRDAHGQPIPGDLHSIVVKQEVSNSEVERLAPVSEDVRNGNWIYASFDAASGRPPRAEPSALPRLPCPCSGLGLRLLVIGVARLPADGGAAVHRVRPTSPPTLLRAGRGVGRAPPGSRRSCPCLFVRPASSRGHRAESSGSRRSRSER
jgi:hypothetical protein